MGDSSGVTIDYGLRAQLLAYLRRSNPNRFHSILMNAMINRNAIEAAAWRYKQMALWMSKEFGVRVWAISNDNNHWMETDSDDSILILKLSIL